MEFKEGAEIYAAHGDKVGKLTRVVLDPRNKEVSHVVVRKGGLLGEDKVVPISLVGNVVDESRIELRPDAGDLEELPDFEETEYVPSGVNVTSTAYEQPVYWYPSVGVSAWAGPGLWTGPAPQYVQTTTLNIPEGTVALQHGARVVSSDDEHVGDVEEILTESLADRVTHLVVGSGLLVKKQRLIPSHWISAVVEDEVILSVPSDVVDSLPKYEQES